MLRSALVSGVAALGAAIGGCAFALDGYSGGAADGPPSLDAGGDAAPANDGAAGLDAGDDGDAPSTPSPCGGAASHLFCADFDESADPDLGWDSSNQDHGTLSVDGAISHSAPQSLLCVVKPASGVHDAELAKTIDVPSRAIHVEMDVRVEEQPAAWTGQINAVTIGLSPAPAGASLHLVNVIFDAGGGADLQYYEALPTAVVRDGDLVAVPAGRWFHVTVDISLAAPAIATAGIDGATASVPLDGNALTSVSLQIGAPYTENVADTRNIHFDDVFVDSR